MIAVRYIPFLCVPLIVEAVIPHSANGQGNEAATSELPSSHSDFTVTATASLAEIVGAVRKLFVDLGTLKSGAQGVATIEIDNPFDEPIPITAARASCACAQSKLLTNVIPSKGSAPLQVLLSIPGRAASASFNGTIELQVDR